MDWSPIYTPVNDGVNNLSPRLGVHIIYEPGDHEELRHFLLFLKKHFSVSDNEIVRANCPPDGIQYGRLPTHPYFQIGHAAVSLPHLLSKIPHLEKFEFPVIVGYLYPGSHYNRDSVDMLTYRAYKAHLERETSDSLDMTKQLHGLVEKCYFPTGSSLH